MTSFFNRNFIRKKREQLKLNSKNLNIKNFFTYGADIISDLLEDIDFTKMERILIFGERNNFLTKNFDEIFDKKNIECEFYHSQFSFEKKYDLIISFFDINSIDNLPLFLTQVKNHLTADGVFIGVLIGEESLLKSRALLWTFEEELTKKCNARIWPMIRLQDMTALLQQAGFNNVISFKENLDFHFNDVISCLRLLKSSAENGGLVRQEYFSKNVYKALLEKKPHPYQERFEIVAFYASLTTNSFATKLEM